MQQKIMGDFGNMAIERRIKQTGNVFLILNKSETREDKNYVDETRKNGINCIQKHLDWTSSEISSF